MNLLIVEDNKEILESLKKSFRSQGAVVDCAEDGKEGLYKATVNNYDLIILDIGLPNMNGADVCRGIRKANKDMPIIVLSVESETQTKADLFDIGADDYVTKPFSLIELSARVKACLRRPRKMTPEIHRIDNVSIDSPARTVKVGTKEIHFTPKEFFILEYLMRHHGKVVQRQELMEHIWGADSDLFTNTVETHIASIRRKLRDKSKKDFINTVSNGGYKIA